MTRQTATEERVNSTVAEVEATYNNIDEALEQSRYQRLGLDASGVRKNPEFGSLVYQAVRESVAADVERHNKERMDKDQPPLTKEEVVQMFQAAVDRIPEASEVQASLNADRAKRLQEAIERRDKIANVGKVFTTITHRCGHDFQHEVQLTAAERGVESIQNQRIRQMQFRGDQVCPICYTEQVNAELDIWELGEVVDGVEIRAEVMPMSRFRRNANGLVGGTVPDWVVQQARITRKAVYEQFVAAMTALPDAEMQTTVDQHLAAAMSCQDAQLWSDFRTEAKAGTHAVIIVQTASDQARVDSGARPIEPPLI